MRKFTVYSILLLTCGLGFIFMTKGDFARLHNPANTPNNLEESFAELDRILPQSEKLMIRLSSDSSMLSYHRGLGMALRNEWGLWQGSKISKYFKDQGIHHADDMSSIILKSYWKRLHNQPLQLEEQIAYYKVYWEKVRQQEAEEKAEIPKRIKRVQDAMVGWTYQDSAAPAVILPKRDDFPGVWKLEPYRGGFLVVMQGFKGVINEAFSHVWHSGIYFVASPNTPMQPVRKEGCDDIQDVVTHHQITYWLCKKPDQWLLLAEESNHHTQEIPVNLAHPWLRLVTSKDGILLMSEKTIYQLEHTQWTEKFTSHHSQRAFSPFDQTPPSTQGDVEWSFPEKGDTPRVIDKYIYLWPKIDDNRSSLYRLDMSKPEVNLESIDEFFIHPHYGNWARYAIQILPMSNDSLWIATTSVNNQDTLVELSKEKIKIPIYGGQVKFDGILGDTNPKDQRRKNFISARALYPAANDVVYLAGLTGIFKVKNGIVQPVVHFQFPPGVDLQDYEEGYRREIQPQKLARFEDGTFLIGDAYAGLYRLQKQADGSWQLLLFHQKIGEVATFGLQQ
jgi:hypothetical protein